MGRHEADNWSDRLGPKIWARFLLHRFGCVAPQGLKQLDACLTVAVTPGEHFEFGMSPRPLESALCRNLFRPSFEDGHTPDGCYLRDVDDSAKFNLFDRVTKRVPDSAPWLLQDARPYLDYKCPTIDVATHVCEHTWRDLAIVLVPYRCLEPWTRIDPEGAANAERVSSESVARVAHPSALAALLATNHLFAWNQADSRLRDLLDKLCAAVAQRVAATFEDMQFDNAGRLGDQLVAGVVAGIQSIRRYGHRSMMARTDVSRQCWDWTHFVPERIVFVPDTQDVRDAMFCLHADSHFWFETLLDAPPDRYFPVNRIPSPAALREAADVLGQAAGTLERTIPSALGALSWARRTSDREGTPSRKVGGSRMRA